MEGQTRLSMKMRLGTVAITSLLVTASWLGCGGDNGTTNSVTTSGSGGTGGGGGAGGAECGQDFASCNGLCVNVLSDATNCGACGVACAAGEVCDLGGCALNCAGGSTKCGNACVDVQNDPAHCGNCDTTCAAGEVCDNGTCALVCSGGSTQCGASCVNTQNDPNHCGACNNLCAFGEVCNQGTCGLVCTGGTVKCGSSCANVATDAANCGSCFNTCGPAQVCSNGVCSLVCGGGTTKCGGSCVDTSKDQFNCGGCANVCGPGLACQNGTCTLVCGSGTTKCGNACVNTQNDSAHCGGCDNPCPQGQVCSAGVCTVVCGPGTTQCGASCVDVQNDPTHCGNCQTSCGPYPNATAVCVAGSCASFCNEGQADCNNMMSDGCEAALSADPLNCGSCGTVCPGGANASGTCAAGACGLACNTGFGNCDGSAANGCETNTQTTAAHCGMCGNACPGAPNASATCAGSACGYTCDMGYGDCNLLAGDGCEVNTQSNNANCGACGVQCLGGLTCINGACSSGQLPPLSGTNNVDLIRGQTYNAFFADPVTGKVYWGQSYQGTQILEYPDMANFQTNTNAVTINLPNQREGTYHAALGGFIYYNSTNTMYRINAANGSVANFATLPGAGYQNQSHYDWGGYSDIAFYTDTGNLLYVYYGPNGGGQPSSISRLDPVSLAVQQTWSIPTSKPSNGFGFLVNGRFYFGDTYSSPAIKGMYTLATSTYDAAYTNQLTPVSGDYVAHTYWDPGGKRLLEVTTSHHLVYPNVQ